MNTLGSLLIFLAQVALAIWSGAKVAAVAAWRIVDAALQPILSPLIGTLNPICTRVGDAVYAMLDPLPVSLRLIIPSVAAGAVMLVAFRYASNQRAIGRAKDDIKANLLALKLYKDELRVTLLSQWRILGAIGRLQWHILKPVLLMTMPMLLLLAQMGVRHQWRPLRVGEQTLLRVEADDPESLAAGASIEPIAGVVVEAGPIAADHDFVWRIRAVGPGRHSLRLTLAGTVLEKDVVVGEPHQPVSAARPGADWTLRLLHPLEGALPGGIPARNVEVLYPGVDSMLYGSNYWVLSFFVVSMVAALVLKPLFRVRF